MLMMKNRQIIKDRQMSTYLQTAIIVNIIIIMFFTLHAVKLKSHHYQHTMDKISALGVYFLIMRSYLIVNVFMYMQIIYSDVVKILLATTGNHDQVVIGKGIFLKRNSTGIYSHLNFYRILTKSLLELYEQFGKVLLQSISSTVTNEIELPQTSEQGKTTLNDLEVGTGFFNST